MLECYCRSNIWAMCRFLTGAPPKEKIMSLKDCNQKAIAAWKYEGFYEGGMSGYGFIWIKRYESKRVRNDTFRKAVGMFARNGDLLFRGFLNERYKGNLETAILQSANFDDLFDQFEKWFGERKNRFMDKTFELIKQLRPDLKNVKQISTHSHGGVANLLKVLTKTMHEQGSTIKTIAKVQYAVCLQAGIYVPEEFLTDVLTAADIDPNVFMESDEREREHMKGLGIDA